MNLIKENLILREIRENDMPFLNKLMNSPNISKDVVGASNPVTMSEQMSWYHNLKNEQTIRYIIALNDKIDEPLGTIIISRLDWKNKNCSMDIKLDEKYQGKGYGTKTISIIVKYIFEELNMNRIGIGILDYNIGSQKIFEKNGFIKEGEQKDAVYKNGKYNSIYLYSILKKDYKNERNRQ